MLFVVLEQESLPVTAGFFYSGAIERLILA